MTIIKAFSNGRLNFRQVIFVVFKTKLNIRQKWSLRRNLANCVFVYIKLNFELQKQGFIIQDSLSQTTSIFLNLFEAVLAIAHSIKKEFELEAI